MQKIGCSMGTICAAQRADLILRMYELSSDQCQKLIVDGNLTQLRFLGDGLCPFPFCQAEQIHSSKLRQLRQLILV